MIVNRGYIKLPDIVTVGANLYEVSFSEWQSLEVLTYNKITKNGSYFRAPNLGYNSCVIYSIYLKRFKVILFILA